MRVTIDNSVSPRINPFTIRAFDDIQFLTLSWNMKTCPIDFTFDIKAPSDRNLYQWSKLQSIIHSFSTCDSASLTGLIDT